MEIPNCQIILSDDVNLLFACALQIARRPDGVLPKSSPFQNGIIELNKTEIVMALASAAQWG